MSPLAAPAPASAPAPAPEPGLARAANALGYQCVWIAAVAGAGQGASWPGPLCALVFAALTLAFGGRRRDDLRTLAVALPVGFALDSAFAASGVLMYSAPMPMPWVAPLWVWALWAAFALTLNHSLAFLRDRLVLCAVLGAIGGPLAYLAASGAFDAVSFGGPVPSVLVALALAWGVALPAIVAWSSRLLERRP